MNKDFTEKILIEMPIEKKLKTLFDLASFIEQEIKTIDSHHFDKLNKYHLYLRNSTEEKIKILNKEFAKITHFDYQFQIYIMNLERFIGQSSKEYQFLIKQSDQVDKKRISLPITCLLDSIRSAHNVGAMFRNAECFGVEKILLCGLSPKADHPQVIKTAMDTDKYIPWEYHLSAIKIAQEYKQKGYIILSVETTTQAKKISELAIHHKPVLLIFGHEQFGISKELLDLSDYQVHIELLGHKNSLNVSVCQGIILQQLSENYLN